MANDRIKKLKYAFGHHRKVDVFYITSDDQMFRRKTDADNHAKTLEDKGVDKAERKDYLNAPTKEEIQAAAEKEADEYRESLFAKHEQLFGKLPAVNAKNETIEKKITEHEAKLKEESKGAEGEKYIVTAQDLKDNPELVEQGVKEGDEITLPGE